jgi:hypothetical protein
MTLALMRDGDKRDMVARFDQQTRRVKIVVRGRQVRIYNSPDQPDLMETRGTEELR